MGATSDFASAVSAWQEAAQELSIDVISPFIFEHEGRTYKCIAWLPHFFRKEKGVLIADLCAYENGFRADAERAGYAYSLLSMTGYSKYDKQLFIDTLWTGAISAQKTRSRLGITDKNHGADKQADWLVRLLQNHNQNFHSKHQASVSVTSILPRVALE